MTSLGADLSNGPEKLRVKESKGETFLATGNLSELKDKGKDRLLSTGSCDVYFM